MKNLTLKLLIVAVPIIMMSCGGQQNRNNDDNNTTLMGTDTTNNDAVLVDDNNDINAGSNKAEDFIEEAVNGGLMEVELGRYAQQNANHTRVRNFGAMMVRDHSNANEELKSILDKKNITYPSTMNDKQHDIMTDLQKKTGADFDKEYMKEMVDDHEKDVDKFKKFAENGDDPELKSFAAKTLPVLLMHLDSAKSINDALK
jgi:putative membrane protein